MLHLMQLCALSARTISPGVPPDRRFGAFGKRVGSAGDRTQIMAFCMALHGPGPAQESRKGGWIRR
jgi:hypothetical protein